MQSFFLFIVLIAVHLHYADAIDAPGLGLGNSIVLREVSDIATDIQFVDRSNCFNPDNVSEQRTVTHVQFFVQTPNQADHRFQIYTPQSGGGYRLKYQSEAIASTVTGIQTYQFREPLGFTSGDCPGWSHEGRGTVSFGYGGNDVQWKYGRQNVGSVVYFDGSESRGKTASYSGSPGRTYSYFLHFAGMSSTSTTSDDGGVAVPVNQGSPSARTADKSSQEGIAVWVVIVVALCCIVGTALVVGGIAVYVMKHSASTAAAPVAAASGTAHSPQPSSHLPCEMQSYSGQVPVVGQVVEVAPQPASKDDSI